MFEFCVLLLFQICLASQISFHVRYLDKKVCESIENPVLLGGKYLYRDLLDLAIFLQKIEQTMKDGDRKGDRQAMDIIEEGGLMLPNITQDNAKIMEAFNWTLAQAEELKKKTIDVAGRWHSILKTLNRPPFFPVDYDIDSEKFVQGQAQNLTA